ncbi:MAG: hypothetical protein HS104_03640 [Polyangiaceae bacterium]|nr:hypothetical protein [Polyangiaceae bacterium]MCL4750515.1 hypothetical protein [Myxococcales bacterium]
MRLLLLFVGLTTLGGLSGCAQSETVSGGGAFGGVGGDGGPGGGSGGALGGAGGAGGAVGGAGGATGGAAGMAGAGGGGTGGGGTGGGGTGGGGTGGSSACTPPVAGGQCDTSPQCGCTGGQACNVTSEAGTTQCTPAGAVTPYNLCANLNDCTAGHACVGSACKAYCESNTDCAATGGACFQVSFTSGGTSKPIPGMKVCSKKCELQNPASACGSGLTCYPDMQAVPPKTDCGKAGTSTAAGACLTDTTACAPGYACLSNGDCKKWCRVQFTGDCGTGKTCQGWASPNEVIVDGITYGICSP